MAAELFVDTSAWYPLALRAHPEHPVLARTLQQAVRRGVRIITTNLVVAETHALLMRWTSRETALAFAKALGAPPNVVVYSTRAIEVKAIADWLERYDDQDFSFADAVSFAVMTERDITDALTLDRHFAAAGFRLLPPQSPPRSAKPPA